MAASFEISNLSAWYGNRLAIEDISLSVEPNQVTALIGPSGCGKSTLVRCLNRLHELVPGARAEGKVVLDGTATNYVKINMSESCLGGTGAQHTRTSRLQAAHAPAVTTSSPRKTSRLSKIPM